MPEARAQIPLLGLCLLQQRAGEKQAEGKKGLDWDGEERKEECLRELEKEAPLFAMQTTGPHLVGLVVPVLILQQSSRHLKPQLHLGAEAMSGYATVPCSTACSPDRRVHPRPATLFWKLLLASVMQGILGTLLLSQCLGLYTNKLNSVRESSWTGEVHQLHCKITLLEQFQAQLWSVPNRTLPSIVQGLVQPWHHFQQVVWMWLPFAEG